MREKDNKTFLTDKQIAILKMKKKGMSQADIARNKKTTRGNICHHRKDCAQKHRKS